MTEASPAPGEHGLHRSHRRRGDHRRLSVRLRQRGGQRHPAGPDRGLRPHSGSFSPGNGLGFTVGSLLIGCFIGAFFAGRLADVIGRRNVMLLAAVLFLVGALVQGLADDHLIFIIARLLRRHGGRRGERAFARLHLRGRAGEHPRPADDGPADDDHHRPHRRLRGQLFPGRRPPAHSTATFWRRARGLALDVPDPGAAGGDLPRRLVLHSREPALSGRPRARRTGRDSVLDQPVRRRRSRTPRSSEIQASFADDHRPRLQRRAPRRRHAVLGIRPIVWVGIMLAVFQQLVGINVIFYYGATLWQLAGFTERRVAADQHRLRRSSRSPPASSRSC